MSEPLSKRNSRILITLFLLAVVLGGYLTARFVIESARTPPVSEEVLDSLEVLDENDTLDTDGDTFADTTGGVPALPTP